MHYLAIFFRWDYLEVICNGSAVKLCGPTLPQAPELNCAESSVEMMFKSDGTIQWTGFYLSYTCNKLSTEDCGGNFYGPSGVISSPNYPNNYTSNVICNHTIQCNADETVNITFISFDVEYNDNCV